MAAETLFMELSFDRETLRFDSGPAAPDDGLYVLSDGIEGWYSTPDPKWQLTERANGDGAHAVEPSAILYAARTVTAHCTALSRSRAGALDLLSTVKRCSGKQCGLRLVDAASDTYAIGMPSVTAQSEWRRGRIDFELTMACPDPRRLSTSEKTGVATTMSGAGGLFYGADRKGLAYPLSYGDVHPKTYAVLTNEGTAPAFPIVTISGPVSGTVRVDMTSDGRLKSVEWAGIIGAVPLVLDYLRHTARIGTLDVSRQLQRRGFSPIGPSESATFAYVGPRAGWASVEVHDTYI